MIKPITFTAIAVSIIAALSSPASAQSVDARATVAAQQTVQFYRPGEFSLNGQPTDHDIVLMEPHQPWYFVAHGEADASDNAFLTAPKHADAWVVGSAEAGFESTIAESFDVQIGGQAAAARFNKYSQLDTDSLAGVVSVSKLVDAVRVGAEYIPSVYFGRGYNDQSLLSHELAAFGRYVKPIGDRSIFVGYARLSRRWTTPHDFTSNRVAVTAAWQEQCTPRVAVTGGVTVAYVLYDDYFESLTGQRRRDLLVNPFVAVTYQCDDWTTLGVSLSLARNYSGIDQVDYEAGTISPYIEFNWRF
jgi:hypothetical protein